MRPRLGRKVQRPGPCYRINPPAMYPAFLVLVARNAPAALLAGLSRAGIHAEFATAILIPEQVPARATAIIWFADDFPIVALLSAAGRLRAQRAGLRLVLVTESPDEITAQLVQTTGRVGPLVLRSPPTVADVLATLRCQPALGATC